MAGFAARTDTSTGVHDQLWVRALVVDHVALVTVDCCALHENTCAEINDLVGDLVGDPVDDVVVAATHTHAGPSIAPGRLGPLAPSVLAAVVRAAVDAVGRATGSVRSCAVSYTEMRGVGVAADRRHLDRAIDPPLQAIRFTDGGGQVIAHLISYPCHPVVLDASNTLISADYPGRVRTAVENDHPGSICMFATGAAGDINTGHSAEESYSTQRATNRTFDEANRIGTALASALRSATFKPLVIREAALLHARPVRLPFAAVDQASVAAQAEAWRQELDSAPAGRAALLRSWIGWADHDAGAGPDAWTGRVGLIRLGELSVISLPGEPFWAVAEAIRRQGRGPTMVLGYSDGVPGYFPTMEDYPDGGYEVCDAHRYYGMPAPFAAGCAEQLVAAAVSLINS